MTYTIGYSPRPRGKVDKAVEPDAKAALKTILGLKASDEIIRYIKAPWGGNIEIDRLRVLADEEAKGPGSI
jgi:hypothetical protein